MNKALKRIGMFAARRHWLVIGTWLVILLSLGLLRGQFGGTFVNDYTVPGSESAVGGDLLTSNFPAQSGYAGQIVFHARTGQLSSSSSAVNEAMKNVGKLPDVTRSVSPFGTTTAPGSSTPTQNSDTMVSDDGTIAYGNVAWSVAPASLDETYLHRLDQAVQPARAAGLQVEYGGGAGQIGQQADDTVSEIIGLVCAFLLLLFMFGSFMAAAVPLLSAIFSVGAGLSIVGLLAAAFTFPTTGPTVATLLGLGVAVDYGLFLVARHREQVDHGMPMQDSIGTSVATSGSAVLVAGSTVVIAILGLYVSGVPFVGAMGAAAAIVVAVTMAAALTLTPALMGATGKRVRAMKRVAAREARKRGSMTQEEMHEHSAFARWGRMVSERPVVWGAGATALLILLALPVFDLRLGQLDAGTNPTSESIRRAYDLIAKGFGPGYNGPISVVVQMPEPSPQDMQSLLTDIVNDLTNANNVKVVAKPQINDSNTVAVINVIPLTSPQDAATTDVVNDIRDNVLAGIPAATYVTGTTAGYVDFTERTSQRMLWLILAVVALSFVLLMTAFRSIVIATKAAVLNLLSVAASYGVIVAVFQWGWGSSLIGIDEKLPIPAFVPMLMFAVVFGLSMDYEVFLLTRVHEIWSRTGDAHRSVALAIGGTARVITTAAAIMVVVFTSFVLDDDPTIKMLAVGMAVAVLIDATVVRMALVPAVMSLLGKGAWYLPAWLDNLLPNLDIEGSQEAWEPPEEQAAVSPEDDDTEPVGVPERQSDDVTA